MNSETAQAEGLLGRRPFAGLLPQVTRWIDGDRRVLLVLVAMALIHGVLYALIVPPFTGPDEGLHFRYVKALWSGNTEEIRSFEHWQPPTYARLVSVGCGLTTGKPEQTQVAVTRLVSLLLRLPEVILAYLIARMLSPANRFVCLSTAAIVALLPGRAWIGAMINNDNLASVVAAALLYFLTDGVLRGFSRRSWIGLGVLVPLALMSKLTTWPVVAVVVLISMLAALGSSWKRPVVRYLVVSTALVVFGVLLLLLLAFDTGNLGSVRGLLADPGARTGISTVGGGFARVIWRQVDRIGPEGFGRSWDDLTNLPTLRPEPFIFQFESFWFPMWRDDLGPPDSAQLATLALCIMAAVGLIAGLLLAPFRSGYRATHWNKVVCIMVLSMVVVLVWGFALLRHWVSVAGTGSFLPDRLDSTALTARYVFPALVPVAYTIASGLSALLHPRFRPAGLAALVTFLLGLDGVGYYLLVSSAYWWPS